MRATLERSAGPVDQDVPAVPGGAAYRTALERRLAPHGARAEPRPRAVASRRGLRSPVARPHSGQWADGSGDATPSGGPQLLRRARWDPEAGRDERRRAGVQHLGAAAAVRGLDATGWLNKGRQAAGVTRQYRRTAGRMDNGQSGGLVGDASRHGQAVLDRERSLPAAWTTDRGQCQHAGLPADRGVATQPALAKEMRQHTLVAGGLAQWVTGDRGDGADRRRRVWRVAQPQAQVLAVSGQDDVWLDGRQRHVKTILAPLASTPRPVFPRHTSGRIGCVVRCIMTTVVRCSTLSTDAA